MRHSVRVLFLLAVLGFSALATFADDKNLPDLSEYKSVENAQTTRISRTVSPDKPNTQPGYAGLQVDPAPKGGLVIAQLEPESPAAKAGLLPGDMLREVAGQKIESTDGLRKILHGKTAGDELKVTVTRKDRPMDVVVKLEATSRPMTANGPRAYLGIQAGEAKDGGVRLDRVLPGAPAIEAGLKDGDILLKLDGKEITSPDKITDVLGDKKPGDTVPVVVKRDGKEAEIKVKLGTASSGRGPRSWDDRVLRGWTRDVYKLAVVPMDFSDQKHNDKITPKNWSEALFSKGSYTKTSVTGQTVYGSLNDFYLEQSCGKFHVEGKVFDHVPVTKKRDEYASGNNRFALFNEAIDKLLERDGKDALKDFDGIFFLYSGRSAARERTSLYWPHRSSFSYKGKNWAYFICPEGGDRMNSISVIAHEFGHMLGLPDLYATPGEPNSEGLGVWCTMATGHGQDGKPRHFSAWCKERLGWLTPAVIDPTVKQKLILSPVENSTKECYKVLLQPDGSEYLLLENRLRKGFDRDLNGEGLLIWRVIDGRPFLEESHGLTGPQGPGRFLESVPFPSKANNAYTPYTTPSSKPTRGDGLPVHITNIRRLPDGRITFHIGYEYL